MAPALLGGILIGLNAAAAFRRRAIEIASRCSETRARVSQARRTAPGEGS